jgi:two-component system KDP operon response regulator KdpE
MRTNEGFAPHSDWPLAARMMPAILIIDGDLTTRRALRSALGTEGYRTWEASNARDALLAFAARAPQAVLLDLNLPDGEGLEVLARIRDRSDVPVLAMSGDVAGSDQVEALDSGANDYILKPFREAELLARLRAALRVATRRQRREEVLTIGRLRLETRNARVFLRDREILLTPTEFRLLEVLARDAGRVVTHRRLLSSVWGAEYVADVQYLRVFMRRLRCKLETDPDAPELLVTAPRVGYRLRTSD